jgi:hypothetical protein
MQEEEIFYERKTRVRSSSSNMDEIQFQKILKSRGKIDILIIINMDANVYSHVGLSFIWFVPYAFFFNFLSCFFSLKFCLLHRLLAF